MKKVLVVDDDLVLREVCQRILERAKYEVNVACNGKEALKILNSSFDLVISDFIMPDFDGYWLAKRIIKKYNKKIPIIIMSSSLSKDIVKIGKEIGINGFIFKPFDVLDFLYLVSCQLN